jgi:tetratricopeptide (TPR) repeat protein
MAIREFEDDASTESHFPSRRSNRKNQKKGPSSGFIIGTAVVLTSIAIGTFVIITKAPEGDHLIEKGERELANAQFAFAVETLKEAAKKRPKDPKVFLELARGYVGIDQVDKAWECVSQAQKSGSGIASEPALASDLANYYRRRGKIEKAIELIRPLATAGVVGKKAELADLDAAWGDSLLGDGKTLKALACWEEVQNLREGSRFCEVEARLATIYQKLASTYSFAKDDTAALECLNKLNNIAQNANNYQMVADIYEREGKLDLAIEQLRKASNLDGKNSNIVQNLASLLGRRGKELLDSGDPDAGYGYLKQAKELNPQNTLPEATLRSVAVSFEASNQPRIKGSIWNPSDKSLNSILFKVELWNSSNAKSLWQTEQKIVDEFTPPLNSQDSKSFDLTAPVSISTDGQNEFRTYINGQLYKSYILDHKEAAKLGSEKKEEIEKNKRKEAKAAQKAGTDSKADSSAPEIIKNQFKKLAAPLQPATSEETPSRISPAPPMAVPSSKGSAEEKTMKDLEM